MENLTKRVEKLERLIEPKPEVNIVFVVVNPDKSIHSRMVYNPETGGLMMAEASQYDRQI